MKKLFIMLLAMLSCVVSAYAQSFEIDGISYNVTKSSDGELPGEVEVTGGEIKEEIIIPETVTYNEATYMVTSIGENAFGGCTGLTSATIPESVTTIGENAFNGCSSLSYVEVNNPTPVAITQSTFSNSPNAILYVSNGSEPAYKITTYWNDFKEIVETDGIIPFADSYVKFICVSKWDTNRDGELSYAEAAAVASLGGAFKQKSAVNSFNELQYFKGLTSIDFKEFYLCPYLTSITIPNSVTSIGGSAFWDCPNLTSITIPNSVTEIGYGAFFGCGGLKMVTSEISTPFGVNAFSNDAILVVPKGLRANYKSVSGWSEFAYIFEKGETIYEKEQTDKQGVTYTLNQANDYSFYYSVAGHSGELNTEIVIPTDINGCPVRTVEASAFNGCTSLSSITIPNSVTDIGARAFRDCTGLSSINIPNNVTTIGGEAFYNCSGLTMITSEISIPFDIDAFSSFDANLVVPKGSRTDYKSVNGWNFAFTYEEGEIIFNREQTDEQGVYYTLRQAHDGSIYYSVTGHSNEANTEIIIPTDINGCPVRTVEASAFTGCTSLSSITIPNSVTDIGARAFRDCTGLSSINIPNNVTTIGGEAFRGCSGLTYISIGRGITILEAATFYGCSGLTTITIPNSVTCIKDGYHGYLNGGHAYFGVFSGCSSLVSVIIGNGMTSIGSYAFYGCSSLASVKMGRNICSIGVGSFQGCSNLTSIALPNTLENIGSGAFQGSSLESVNIPKSVETIGNEAFKSCGSLASVSFEDGITSIGDGAFNGCALTSVTIPNSVTTIGGAAFANNNNLRIAILSDGITEIEQGMFSGCYFLSSVIIPSGVTSIGDRAFWNCQCLASIKLPESLTSLGEQVFERSILKSIELPNAFTIIPENLFQNNNSIQYVKLGNNVQSIGKNAFGSRELLLEIGTSTPPTISSEAFPNIQYLSDINVIVPDAKAETAYRKAAVWEEMTFSNQNNVSEVTVDTPGDLSFELITDCNMMPAKVVGLKVNGTINADDFNQMLVNMKSLLRLDLSDCDITEIPDGAMSGKTQLQALTLPTSLQSIGQNAFQNCTYLTELTMQNGLQSIGKNAFQGCTYLTGELNLPSTVTAIGESAFVGTGYTSVKLPSTLKTIGDYAFRNLPIMQLLTLPRQFNSVGASAFAGTKITGLVIPDGVTSIGDYAFAETPIQGHVTIPDGVTYLGNGAFSKTQISTVFLPNSVTTLSEGLFQGCPNLNTVYVPDNFTALSGSAFDGCGALTVLRLSANLTSMGAYSFQNTPLEYVKVPSQVEVLPQGVFKNSKSLESLTLPTSLKTVEAEALYGCTALRNLSVEAVEPPVIKDRSAIRGINTDLCLISIPTQSYRQYVLAEYWGQFVQMRNDIAVETAGNGTIAFESVEEEEEDEELETKSRGQRSAARAMRRVSELAAETEEETMTLANNGSSIYVPQDGKVRLYIIPAEGEELLSATLDGEDIMPYIEDSVYIATADKRNAKLVVVFSEDGQGGVVEQPGDVNGDGEVSVTDVGCVINYILEQIPDPFIYAAADMNGDESISVTDVGYIINYILTDGAAYSLAKQRTTYSYGVPELILEADGHVLTLGGADAFIGFQMDIIASEGCNVQLAETGTDHLLACRQLSNGHYRVVCYSPTNETFAEGLTDLLTIGSDGDVTISDIRFTTKNLEEVHFADMDALPTGIANAASLKSTDLKTSALKVYTLGGQLYRKVQVRPGDNPLKDLQPGIYLINGRKIIVK